MSPFFLRGLLIGFSIAAPVGPIGVLCIRRTLSEGRLAGFLSGLGAASADALYGAVAALGLSLVTDLLVGQQSWLRLLGGLFLIYLGTRAFFTRTSETPAKTRPSGLARAYFSTFLLTLTNPLTVLSFAAIFAGLDLAEMGGHSLAAAALVAGVFLGSSAWWLTLSALVGSLRGRFTPVAMAWVNRLAGLVLFGFGAAALLVRNS
jgi:threonine/homoserine/homoserine lactone efflux protein